MIEITYARKPVSSFGFTITYNNLFNKETNKKQKSTIWLLLMKSMILRTTEYVGR